MFKNFSIIAVSALVLASCSNDEEIAVNKGTPIEFRITSGSRATEITTANLDEIWVSAVENNEPYFTDVKFYKSGSTFISDTKYYWPESGTLHFYACAPALGVIGVSRPTLSDDGFVLTGFHPKKYVKDQVDLIIATAKGSKVKNDNNVGVELNFQHALSQIVIKAKNTNSKHKIEVYGVKIANSLTSGTCTYSISDESKNAWTLVDNARDDYSITYHNNVVTLDEEERSLMGTEGCAMLIPQKLKPWNVKNSGNDAVGAYIGVAIKATTSEGANIYPTTEGGHAWVAVPIDTHWHAGKRYTYILDFTDGLGYVAPDQPRPGTEVLGGIINFTCTVDAWVDANQATDGNTNINMKPSNPDAGAATPSVL